MRVERLAVPYLPSVEWYAGYVAWHLGVSVAPRLPKHFCRADIVAPFGRRTLSVPVEGGRRQISARRYGELRLSEHGGWRHTHFDTIASAYGSTPYFHYYEDELRDIYSRRFGRLEDLCLALHDYIDRAASLSECIRWIRDNSKCQIVNSKLAFPECNSELSIPNYQSSAQPDLSLSMLHLLFHEGPASIFTLLTRNNSTTDAVNH